jgi:hypothetical protein
MSDETFGESNLKDNSKLIKATSILLLEIITENKLDLKANKEPVQGKSKLTKEKAKSVFNCKKPPSITVQGYLERIVKYSKLERSTLIMTLIYIDRMCDFTGLLLSDFNVHR